jgi:hypothetical protein
MIPCLYSVPSSNGCACLDGFSEFTIRAFFQKSIRSEFCPHTFTHLMRKITLAPAAPFSPFDDGTRGRTETQRDLAECELAGSILSIDSVPDFLVVAADRLRASGLMRF